jgi:catechol 2,3-dioxygenase-like lactoylglutathione lyase family enzyme
LIEEGLEEPASERGHFALRVADIEEAARHLQAKKVAFNGPFRRPDGALQIFTEDPDGHTVELCWLEGANRP